MKRRNTIAGTLFAILSFLPLCAQQALTYQKPPKEILELVDVERAPSVIMDSKRQVLVFLYSNMYKSIEEISAREMKLGGLRINPDINTQSGARYYTRIAVQLSRTGQAVNVSGFPENAMIANISWSPDEKYLGCTRITDKGLELWVIDVQKQTAKQLAGPHLNGNLGTPYSWFGDSRSMLVRMLPKGGAGYIDAAAAVPAGPSVSVSDGTVAQNRTYQDLLKNQLDEQNFEQAVTSELHRIGLDGSDVLWKAAAMHSREQFSPDGKYVLVTTIHKPFSYIVAYYNFPAKTDIYDQSGKLVTEFDDRPLLDNLPKGFMATQKGKRWYFWRDDKPATLCWLEALDGGDPAVETEFRDELYAWDAPFAPNMQKALFRTPLRFNNIIWGNDNTAIVYEEWYNTRKERTYLFNPSAPEKGLKLLFERNSQDEYANPGNFETVRNQYGREVLLLNGTQAYLIGEGYTPEGQFPFVHTYDLKKRTTAVVYKSMMEGKKERIVSVIDPKAGELLVRIESPTDYPNYFVRNTIRRIAPVQITRFENPFKNMEGVSKEVITYKRADGLELSATLYLPAGYDKAKKEKLPMVMWAYPLEYKDKNSASQNTTNPNEFIFPYYGSPVYWVTRGYAVLDDAAFPIVGEGDEEPNDTFIEQLVSNAKAAIDAVDGLGYIDRSKVAVGGHSYGAFMTANLLTHSDLFAAGIARSGAYNRSLTPFGFQGEERSYWEAQKVYQEMSPFNYADKMKTPLLLIHGENDNNPGTFPIQSERYFAALKGFGAPVRLVMLPKESHGYAAKESILHLLWEQDQWLEKYVKNKQ